MGLPKATLISRGRNLKLFLGITSRVPSMAMGTTGTPASMATTKIPFLSGRIRPSGLLVPSGKAMMLAPLRMI
jgi:hypothetical protein